MESPIPCCLSIKGHSWFLETAHTFLGSWAFLHCKAVNGELSPFLTWISLSFPPLSCLSHQNWEMVSDFKDLCACIGPSGKSNIISPSQVYNLNCVFKIHSAIYHTHRFVALECDIFMASLFCPPPQLLQNPIHIVQIL